MMNNEVNFLLRNKLKAGIFVLVVLAIVIAGYFLFPALGGSAPSTPVKLTIGIAVANPYVAPVWVAENKGFFKDEGLEVEIIDFGSSGAGPSALTAMVETGSPDIVMPANLPVVFKSFESDEYAIFAGFGKNPNFNILLAREDKGIKVPADLKGKKIGTIKGTTGHYFLGHFLEANKLKISDVEIVDLKALDSIPNALANGQVDAISAWEPYIGNAKKMLGVDAHIFRSKGILEENFYFVAKKDFTKNNQDTLVKFVKAVERGNQFLEEHPLESIDIVSEKSGIDKVTLISQWDDYEFGLFLDQATLASLEEQANWAVENRLVPKVAIPDYRNYINSEILKRVKPEAVQLDK